MKLLLLFVLFSCAVPASNTANISRLRRQSEAEEEELAQALLKRVEGILFYVPNPSAALEAFFVSSIQVAAKYHLERMVRMRIILFEIKETGELEDIIANHPGGNDEAFAEGIIDWAEKYKSKFESHGVSAVNALGKINGLAFDTNFRDAGSEERLSLILEILRSDEAKGPDTFKLGEGEAEE